MLENQVRLVAKTAGDYDDDNETNATKREEESFISHFCGVLETKFFFLSLRY
jgi:hypothetical protein